MTPYQIFKLRVLSTFNLDAKDVIHTYVGLGALFATAILLRKSLRSWIVLIPGFILSILMEVADLHDDVAALGHARWGASIHDVINTNLIPVVLVLLLRFRIIRSNEQ